ncbi:hypothetical protein R1flu_000013 [Riccia fluitans]|uniref:Uncharacterized protein n=1 Tax=Riccia fluitans TaxID=41844 RepID=A0ABD1XZ80_9MARC
MRKLCGFKDFGVSSESGHAPVRNVRKMNLEMNLRKIYHPQARRMAFVLVQVSPDSEVVCESCGVGKLLRFRVLRRSPGCLESPGYLESCARKVRIEPIAVSDPARARLGIESIPFSEPGDWSRARARFRSLESRVLRAQGGIESIGFSGSAVRSGRWVTFSDPGVCRVDTFLGSPSPARKNRVDTFSGAWRLESCARKVPEAGVPSPARGVDTFLGFCGAVRCGAADE